MKHDSEAALHFTDEAAARISEWRRHLINLADGKLSGIPERSFLGREMRAAAVVATMAELEALLREMMIAIGAHVNSTSILTKDLTPSLRTLAANSRFESMRYSSDHEAIWNGRLEVTGLDASLERVNLPGKTRSSPQPPLDGRTIQVRHIAIVWRVLGLTDPIPRASVVTALKKLTQIRNDVAHRNVDIAQVFSEAGRTAREIAGYLDEVVLLVLHIGVEWSEYLEQERFRVNRPARPGA
ncbi:hypothetical protein [Cellulomonas sp. ES6]|uniref:hypothetical protein n=1 Tax=Cellulomonas sp. ES6 TaxID=3039384 RepID=UPI0024B69194|nr:hypothetical protein [Cellulomonas sp. ES6]WHP17859.1 hypothetical protein P9841_01420 [Cellulomonas sp. ES6]